MDDNDKEASLHAASNKKDDYVKAVWKSHVTMYNYKKFKNQELKRRFEMLSILEIPALDEEHHTEFRNITSCMRRNYGTAKVCPLNKRECDVDTEGLDLNPELERIISNPTNYSYEQLSYIWEGWRNATGKVMRESYKKYIHLCNTAAVANNLKDASELWLHEYTRDDNDFREDLESIWQKGGHCMKRYTDI